MAERVTVGTAALTTTVTGDEVADAKSVLPAYAAVSISLPTGNEAILNLATPDDRDPEPILTPLR